MMTRFIQIFFENRMDYPTKSQTSFTHNGSIFLLFLQQAIQKIFIFVFTLNN